MIARTFVFSSVLLCLLAGCGASDIPEDLEQGLGIVKWWTSAATRERSAFPLAYPDEKPSEFLEYIFSPMGAAEWPPMQGGGEFSPEEEATIRRAGMPFIPKGLSFRRNRPSAEHMEQIVLTADDERRVVIAAAYIDPNALPIVTREYEFE